MSAIGLTPIHNSISRKNINYTANNNRYGRAARIFRLVLDNTKASGSVASEAHQRSGHRALAEVVSPRGPGRWFIAAVCGPITARGRSPFVASLYMQMVDRGLRLYYYNIHSIPLGKFVLAIAGPRLCIAKLLIRRKIDQPLVVLFRSTYSATHVYMLLKDARL